MNGKNSTNQKHFQAFTPQNATPVKYTVCLDWFEALLTGDLVEFQTPLNEYKYDLGNIVLKQTETQTKLFKYNYDIFLRGKLFGSVNVTPRNTAVIKAKTIQFKAENNVLYEKDFINECRYLFAKLGWRVLNISRLDIALDGTGFVDFIEQWQSGKYEKLGKATDNILRQHRKFKGLYVGTRSSSKMVRCYIKSKELERSNKYYIGDFWKRTNLQTGENGEVERLEITLKNEALKKIKFFDWRELQNFEYLASVMKSSFENFFEFVEASQDKNVSRKKRVDFIDWQNIGAQHLERLSTKQTTEIYRMKMSCKTLYGLYVATKMKGCCNTLYADMAQEIAININCLNWYIQRLEKWEQFFKHKYGQNKDGLVVYEYMSNFKKASESEQLSLFTIKPTQFSMYENENF
jgi:hypothetical protein